MLHEVKLNEVDDVKLDDLTDVENNTFTNNDFIKKKS